MEEELPFASAKPALWDGATSAPGVYAELLHPVVTLADPGNILSKSPSAGLMLIESDCILSGCRNEFSQEHTTPHTVLIPCPYSHPRHDQALVTQEQAARVSLASLPHDSLQPPQDAPHPLPPAAPHPTRRAPRAPQSRAGS